MTTTTKTPAKYQAEIARQLDLSRALDGAILRAATAIDVAGDAASLDVRGLADGFGPRQTEQITSYAVSFCAHRGWDVVGPVLVDGVMRLARVSTMAERKAEGLHAYSEHSYAAIIGADRARRIG